MIFAFILKFEARDCIIVPSSDLNDGCGNIIWGIEKVTVGTPDLFVKIG